MANFRGDVNQNGMPRSKHPNINKLTNIRTNPYSLQPGNICDFEPRTINQSAQELFPADFHMGIDKSNVPTYQTPLPDELFHFDSFMPFRTLPKTLFGIRVTVLKDATLLGFRVHHYLCDGASRGQAIKAYRDIIAGKQIATSILLPDTPLSKLLQKEVMSPLPSGIRTEDTPYLYPNEKYQLGVRPWIHFLGHATYRTVGAKLGIYGMKSKVRFIHLPGPTIEHWRSECQNDLRKAKVDVPTLSKLDIVLAWFLKVRCLQAKHRIYSLTFVQTSMSHVPPDNSSLVFRCSFSYRFALRTPGPSEVYLNNSIYEMMVHWDSLQVFQDSSLGSLAMVIRRSVLCNKQPEIIKANVEFHEEHFADFVAPTPSRLPIVTSWTAFEHNGLDFSAALIGGQEGSTGEGKVVFTQPKVEFPLGIILDGAFVLKDGSGGYWILANLSQTGWKGHNQ
jgi:hypothetical protein